MEFWGQEVKPGATCKVDDVDGFVIHLSQAALGETKNASENVILSVKIDNQKVVLGTLSVEKHPHISYDLVFDKDFELSHNSKTASVFFCGYKTLLEPDYGDGSDEELEADQVPMHNNETKISTAKVPVKGVMKVESSSDDGDEGDDDFTDSESDSEMSDEDDSSDDDEVSSGAHPSDDSGSEEETPTPKKTGVVGKKRAIEAEAPSGKKAKSEQSAQKTGDKVSTQSAKQSTKTPADKSTKAPTADKKSPKSGGHACKSCNKSFSSASGLESHQKAKKHGA